MKYKLPVPEDYPEIEEYQFKLSKAYSKMYSDFIDVLITLNVVLNSEDQDDPIVRRVNDDMLRKALNKHKVE